MNFLGVLLVKGMPWGTILYDSGMHLGCPLDTKVDTKSMLGRKGWTGGAPGGQ